MANEQKIWDALLAFIGNPFGVAAAVSALPRHGCIIITDDGEVVRNEIYRK